MSMNELQGRTAVITGAASGFGREFALLCPGYVDTGIADAGRHRPPELAGANPENVAFMERTRNPMKAGRLSPADVARITLEAVHAGRFYVFPHRNALPGIEARVRDLLDGRAPNNPLARAS